MNEITIKVVLEDADRSRIDALTAGINRLADVLLHSGETAGTTPAPLPPAMMDAAFNRFLNKQAQEDKIQQMAQTAGVLTPPQSAPATESGPELAPAVIVPLPDFQAAIAKKCAASPAMKAAVRQLVNQYAPSVSEIPEEKRAEVMAALDELKV